ncbi:hypothetical protein K438DRAFT_1852456 [Mycena galopus ATCC 62051]|nr:hypothetical protein K438DRAFT_1859511 [Mycena galopus ATCC 62051]KAF8171555.1 hypothetical protein K438DRAFT_1852456 [Mycena galopus ATCC 62051]
MPSTSAGAAPARTAMRARSAVVVKGGRPTSATDVGSGRGGDASGEKDAPVRRAQFFAALWPKTSMGGGARVTRTSSSPSVNFSLGDGLNPGLNLGTLGFASTCAMRALRGPVGGGGSLGSTSCALDVEILKTRSSCITSGIFRLSFSFRFAAFPPLGAPSESFWPEEDAFSTLVLGFSEEGAEKWRLPSLVMKRLLEAYRHALANAQEERTAEGGRQASITSKI